MEIVPQSFGRLIAYAFGESIWGVLVMLLAGGMLAWFIAGFIQGVEVVAAGKIEKHRGGWWKLVLGIVLLGSCSYTFGLGFLASYFPVFILGILLGALLFLFKWFAFGGIVVVISFCAFLFSMLMFTFHEYSGRTAVLEVKVRSVEIREDDTRISLIVKDPKQGFENTYYLNGTKWGLSMDVVEFEDWVILWGGKTYYRLNSILGADGADVNRTVLDTFSESMWVQISDTWERMQEKDEPFMGIREIYNDTILLSPVVERQYTIYVDENGALVPEVNW